MSDQAPERVWIVEPQKVNGTAFTYTTSVPPERVEYLRADTVYTREQVEAMVAGLEVELRCVRAERDRAQKACEQIAKRFTPKRLRYAPKDRIIIGVERPPFEDQTFYYDLIWCDDLKEWVTPHIRARNGATHFLDPRDLIGLVARQVMLARKAQEKRR